MKILKYISICAASVSLVACMAEMDSLEPQTGSYLEDQVSAAANADPSKAEAIVSGMYTKLGDALTVTGYSTPDNYGFLMNAFSNDLEAADMVLPDSGYNWFSVCGELSSRNASYRNPLLRYKVCYDTAQHAHDVMSASGEITEDSSDDMRWNAGQAYAVRAFAYMQLAPYFSFIYPYADCVDNPCVPIVTPDTEDYAHNPRATLGEVFALIESDLLYAIELLEGYERPSASRIDKQAAQALLARAYLYMNEWDKAYEYAEAASQGYSPASMAEVSEPFFFDISEHNWIWGYDNTVDLAQNYIYATTSSWLRSFSGYSYAAGVGVYACCNSLLYNMIPSSDVRKGWWVTADTHESPLLSNISWGGYSGNAVADASIDDEKEPFLDYTNVKFGMVTYGGTTNEEDFPFIRVEEMILIMAEAKIQSGDEAAGLQILSDFVVNYRDPSYTVSGRNLSALDELWFQRRVELWGEGHSNVDTRRLGKPLVRFHDGDSSSNVPSAFQINMPADDPWWLMRFSQKELNTNYSIIDNEGGSQPTSGQYGELRDGVTD